jgi:SAM-dependent methyltransferase
MDRVRDAWKRAADFPADKESAYHEHALAQRFDDHAKKRVLEYGCGGGSDAMSYLRRGCDVTFVDVVPENVAKAKERIDAAALAPVSTGIVLQNSHTIPLPSAIFDVVNAHGVIHHIPEPLPVLRELRRVLKRGGWLYAMLYTETLYARLADATEALIKDKGLSRQEAFCWGTDGPGSTWADYYTYESGCALLAEAGFEVTSTHEYNAQEFRTFRAVAR